MCYYLQSFVLSDFGHIIHSRKRIDSQCHSHNLILVGNDEHELSGIS
ncbi:protein of unknown function [Xenorhabdus poinarii G6]|uniref:Uncharacterized protein n=1 Tax=Xenorhabdus poinarii G6 TaxID=1354304 RepID=A0A068R7J0_9GAMM|nr:protein of unknown function [Xenorhabdus poinarii G6]